MPNLLSTGKENPAPALVVACVNLIVALALVCIGLLVAVTVSLLTWLRAIALVAKPPTRKRPDRTEYNLMQPSSPAVLSTRESMSAGPIRLALTQRRQTLPGGKS